MSEPSDDAVTAAALALYERDCERSGQEVRSYVWERVASEYVDQARTALEAAQLALLKRKQAA